MTERALEQLLERCLQEVARAGDAEAVLRRYPQQADRLRPLLDVALATSRYYGDVPQPHGELAAGRVRLLDAAAQQREGARATTTPTRKEKKPKMKLLLATRLISAILAAVIGTTAVGGGLTWAASDSLPGEVLYPVKLTGEDLRLSFASTPEGQVELALQFADERVAEVEALVERGLLVPETVVARMERHVFRAMNQAAWASEEEMPGLLKRIAQRTQIQAQTLQQLRAQAQEQNQAQLKNAHRICQRAQEDTMTGLGDPQTFRRRYQHRDSMPEDVTPPEPPTREPQEGRGPGPHGPGGPDEPDENQMDSPQDERPGDRDQDREGDPQQDQDRDRQQDRQGNQQQDRDRDRDQDREDDPQQDQDRDRQQDRQGDPQQDEGRNQQPEQQPGQERDQQQDQQPDQERDQQQDPQRDGQSGDTKGSGGPGS
jgi:hypothetical protein